MTRTTHFPTDTSTSTTNPTNNPKSAFHRLSKGWPSPVIAHGRNEHTLRMRLMACAVLASAAALLPACSSKPDVEVNLQTNPHWGTLMYNIQATTEDVTISQVVINRGSCTVPDGTAAELGRTVKLKFGQSWRGYSPDCKVDNVKELTVTTGRGTYTFGF